MWTKRDAGDVRYLECRHLLNRKFTYVGVTGKDSIPPAPKHTTQYTEPVHIAQYT